MRILIVSDAWLPQINGVVRTLQAISSELEKAGHVVGVIGPDAFRSVACPGYAEIRLALASRASLERRIATFAPDAIHIATEGPLGVAARRWCLARDYPFSTAYHTHFPNYVAARTAIPPAWIWRYIRWFHQPSSAVLVSTETLRDDLAARGIGKLRLWGRGVDTDLFRPDAADGSIFAGIPRPIQLFVGRLAVEKNIAAFLDSRVAGTRVVVGDGPARAELEARYPDVLFTGALGGAPLAAAFAGADVFVFPSRTDTFGLVMIEALACGTPVAAYPVPGPLDILDRSVGAMDEDLSTAIVAALKLDRRDCARHGARFTWAASAQQFVDALVPIHGARLAA